MDIYQENFSYWSSYWKAYIANYKATIKDENCSKDYKEIIVWLFVAFISLVIISPFYIWLVNLKVASFWLVLKVK